MVSTTGASSGVRRQRIVVGNWKMFGSRAANASLVEALLREERGPARVVVCPPAAYLGEVGSALRQSDIALGAQDCSRHGPGAYTGEVAAAMLADIGCRYVVVGHSERRAMHGESDELVAAKASCVLEEGMTPIVCVGESLAEREGGSTEVVVTRQLGAVIGSLDAADAARIVVAYEPVWAIGTGRTATPAQAQAVHARLRAQLAASGAADVPILYGGSVKGDNAAALFGQNDVDGGLVGGASLKSQEFAAICRAAG